VNLQIDMSHLRCFVAVAEELHFGRAAARLNMTQPPLSRQIQVLERILNVTLLERTSRVVKLTAAGRSFLPEAQRILRQTDVAVSIARQIDSGAIGTVRIGFTAATAYSFLPALITACQQEFPTVTLVLNELVTHDQLAALVSGEIDIGLLRPPIARSELASVKVVSEPLVAALPAGHPLAESASVSVRDFDQQPFVMYSSHGARYFHDALTALFAESGVQPRYVQHLVQIHSLLALVRAGVGATIVPQSAEALGYQGVVLRPLAERRQKQIELDLVWRPDSDNALTLRIVELAKGLRLGEPSTPKGDAP
jgi:DNA-binding transcriptional LysR family regulator